jgi:hypothetical protein
MIVRLLSLGAFGRDGASSTPCMAAHGMMRHTMVQCVYVCKEYMSEPSVSPRAPVTQVTLRYLASRIEGVTPCSFGVGDFRPF